MRRSGSLLAALASWLRLRPLAPDIGRDLPSSYADGTKVFDARVKARFPIGTSEQALRAELRRQGFEPIPDHPELDGASCATFGRNELIFRTLCRYAGAPPAAGCAKSGASTAVLRLKAGRLDVPWGASS